MEYVALADISLYLHHEKYIFMLCVFKKLAVIIHHSTNFFLNFQRQVGAGGRIVALLRNILVLTSILSISFIFGLIPADGVKSASTMTLINVVLFLFNVFTSGHITFAYLYYSSSKKLYTYCVQAREAAKKILMAVPLKERIQIVKVFFYFVAI